MKPVTIPNTFQTQSGNVPASELDDDFSALGNAINDASTYGNYAVDTGAVNALVATTTGGTTFSYTLGVWLDAVVVATNTSSVVTVNVNGLGPVAVLDQAGAAIAIGALVAGSLYRLVYDGTAFRAISISVFDTGNLMKYGIVPNSPGAATSNTALLTALLLPSVAGITGRIYFPNTTGSDIYYFNGVMGVRDGISIELQNCTLNNTMTSLAANADNRTGFLTVQRNFSIQNGTIVTNYTAAGSPSNVGAAIWIGGRGTDCPLFPPFYDSLASAPLGNIAVRNMKFNCTSTYGVSRVIVGLGGITNASFENISIDGNSTMDAGCYFEFGWATNEADQTARQTSHAHNIWWRNITVKNCVANGLGSNGSYGWTVDGLHVIGTAAACQYGVGESRFYRPWVGVDQAGAKHSIALRNISQLGGSGTCITITGSSGTINGGYLGQPWQINHAYVVGATVYNAPNLYVCTVAGTSAGAGGPSGTGTGIVDNTCTWNYVNKQASTDLLDAVIENVAANGCGGYGVNLSGATSGVLRNINVTGCQRGVVTSTDCTQVYLDGFRILDCTSFGVQIGLSATGIYSTTRQMVGALRNGFIAGCNASAAISVISTASCDIGSVRFGYEPAHDDKTETTQLQAVTVGADGFGVYVHDCYVAGVSSGNAFSLAGALSSSRGCSLERIGGIQTTGGRWITDFESPAAQAISNGNTIVVDGLSTIRVTAAGAVTGVILAGGSYQNHEITVVHQSAAGNTITFAASGTSNVADGTGDVIAGLTARKFKWDTVTALWYPVK